MKIHCLDYAFLKLCDENPPLTSKNYLKLDVTSILGLGFDLPDDYAVLTTGFTAEVREWPPEEVNKTAKWLVEQGITPVFLGQTQTETGNKHTIKGTFKEEIDFSQGINLIDKTSLLQAATIMYSAKAVLGVDNGLLHVAGCTDVPIIGGFTTVTPEVRMPVRNNILGWNYYPVVPDKSLECSFCQEKTNFLFGHDYRNCIYKGKKAQENQCTKQMTAEKFIYQLKVVLGNN